MSLVFNVTHTDSQPGQIASTVAAKMSSHYHIAALNKTAGWEKKSAKCVSGHKIIFFPLFNIISANSTLWNKDYSSFLLFSRQCLAGLFKAAFSIWITVGVH